MVSKGFLDKNPLGVSELLVKKNISKILNF